MKALGAYQADIHDPQHRGHTLVVLRDVGLVTFDGLRDRAGLLRLARDLLTVRPHRDAGPDGVTVITRTESVSCIRLRGIQSSELGPAHRRVKPGGSAGVAGPRLPAGRRRRCEDSHRRRPGDRRDPRRELP